MKIPVVLAIDDTYCVQARVVLESILRNDSYNCFDFIILIDDNFKHCNTLILKDVEKVYSNCSVQILNTKERFKDAVICMEGFTSATFYRLGIAEFLPQYDKCIYLDSDLLVNGDLKELYDIDIEDYYVAGVRDWHVILSDLMENTHQISLQIPKIDSYVNAGVLLFNLKKIREDAVYQEFYKFMEKGYFFQDQDVINKVCYGRIKVLPEKFNFMISDEVCRAKEVIKRIKSKDYSIDETIPAIIHYAGVIKPWKDVSCRYSENWWEIYESTFYKSEMITDTTIRLDGVIENVIKLKKENIELSNIYKKLIINQLCNYDSVYIYGAGMWGKAIMASLILAGIKAKGFIVSKKSNQDDKGIFPVWSYDEIRKELHKDDLVVLGVSEIYQQEIKQILKNDEIENVMQFNKQQYEWLCLGIGQ